MIYARISGHTPKPHLNSIIFFTNFMLLFRSVGVQATIYRTMYRSNSRTHSVFIYQIFAMNLFSWMHRVFISLFFGILYDAIKGKFQKRWRIKPIYVIEMSRKWLTFQYWFATWMAILYRVLPHTQNLPLTLNQRTEEILEFSLYCNYRALGIYYLWLKLNHMWFNWHTANTYDGQRCCWHTHIHAHKSRIMEKVIILATCRLWPC